MVIRAVGRGFIRRGPVVSGGGSVVLFVLMVCLGMAVAVQALTMVVLCARGALVDESQGRARVGQTESGLFLLRDYLAKDWGPRSRVELDPSGLPGTEGMAVVLDGSEEWAIVVSAVTGTGGTSAPLMAWVERGRDGIDLPLAALVAGRIVLDGERTTPWLRVGAVADGWEGGSSCTAVAHLAEMPTVPLVGEDCVLRTLVGRWGLDDGWREDLGLQVDRHPSIRVVQCEAGEIVLLPVVSQGWSEDEPIMVVVLGGGVLDASNAGEMWGVLVADEGSLLLEGTTLHGAAFASRDVHLGATGVVEWAPGVLAWARERALTRVRLVPGSRQESME